jgi:hypothetical protein
LLYDGRLLWYSSCMHGKTGSWGVRRRSPNTLTSAVPFPSVSN